MALVTALFPLVVLAIILCLSVGSVIVHELGSPQRVAEAKARITAAANQVPSPPNSTLIEKKSDISGGTMEECVSLTLYQLYGTNDDSLKEILDFYSKNLAEASWKHRHVADDWLSYDMGPVLYFGVSDVNTFAFSSATVERAVASYKTAFIVTVNTIIDPGYAALCRQG